MHPYAKRPGESREERDARIEKHERRVLEIKALRKVVVCKRLHGEDYSVQMKELEKLTGKR